MNNTEDFCPADQKDWRAWLQENHAEKDSVWVIFYKKNHPNIT